MYKNYSDILSDFKNTTRKKIELRIKQFIDINEKNIVINFEKNIDDLEDLEGIFSQLYSEIIKAIYESFIKYIIVKNAQFSFTIKDSIVNLNVIIVFDPSKINIISNFSSKIKSIMQLYRLLLLFPVKVF